MYSHSTTSSHGFTLIELIIIMAVGVILVSMSAPSFNTAIQNNKLNSVASSLLSEYSFARSEAVKRNLPVTICGSSDGATCNTSDWEKGRLVFVDDGAGTDSNKANGAVNSEEILRVVGASSNGIEINASLFSTSGYLVFHNNGSVKTTGTMVICDSRSEDDSTTIRAINIGVVGQARLAYDGDKVIDNTVNDIAGDNVSC